MLSKPRSRRWYAFAFVLLALLALVPLTRSAYYTSLGIVVGIHTMLTVGLCLLMGYTGQVSLGHAAFYGLGAFVSGILSATFGVDPWPAMLVAAAVAGGTAFLTGFPIFYLRGHYLAMATLGFGIVVWVFFMELRQFTGGPSGLSGVPPLAVGPLVFNNDASYYYLVWAFCLAVLLLSQNIVNSRPGRALRAIHGNEDAARAVGIDITRYKIQVFVLSAVYASLAGSLYVHYTAFVSPQPFGFMFSVKLVVMVVIGGLASIWGAIFGTATITLLSEVLQPFGEVDIIVFGAILMVVMVFMPQGLFVALRDYYARSRLSRRREARG